MDAVARDRNALFFAQEGGDGRRWARGAGLPPSAARFLDKITVRRRLRWSVRMETAQDVGAGGPGGHAAARLRQLRRRSSGCSLRRQARSARTVGRCRARSAAAGQQQVGSADVVNVHEAVAHTCRHEEAERRSSPAQRQRDSRAPRFSARKAFAGLIRPMTSSPRAEQPAICGIGLRGCAAFDIGSAAARLLGQEARCAKRGDRP